ncbi:retrovirus-related pol polyprotein from transposon TNT 1-94 [Tanacetum coccineum]|uniref:Retrovirus-related pol polyprotein from transposon TNT 1-94 n=1 Tax=Tanacetum coccineum TaxID=301880 RepID=A0ABQ5A5G1_9ASTR
MKARGSNPRSNTKKNRIPPAKTENKKKVEDHPRTNKSVWTKEYRSSFGIGLSCSKHRRGIGQTQELCESSSGQSGNFVILILKHTCFVRDINGTDILKGSRSTNLYTISIDEMMKSSLICLLSKASKSKSWLWHRRLNHLNFGTINDLARKDLVRGLPRLKFEKDHLCSAWLAPTDKELEMLFQPMFDEHLEQSRVNKPVPSATKINAQVVPPGTSLSTTIAQEAPSTSASSSTY